MINPHVRLVRAGMCRVGISIPFSPLASTFTDNWPPAVTSGMPVSCVSSLWQLPSRSPRLATVDPLSPLAKVSPG